MVGSTGTCQPAAAPRRSQARRRARPAYDAGVHLRPRRVKTNGLTACTRQVRERTVGGVKCNHSARSGPVPRVDRCCARRSASIPDVELSAPCFSSQWSQGQNSRSPTHQLTDRFIVRGDTASRRRCWRRGGRPDRAARRPGAGSPEAPLEADGRPARACCLPVSFLE